MKETIKKKPTKVFTIGALKAAVWSDSKVLNSTVVKLHSVRIDRSYKDKDNNEWVHTNVFFAEDLPKLAVLATEVYKWLRLRNFEPESDQNNDGNGLKNELDDGQVIGYGGNGNGREC